MDFTESKNSHSKSVSIDSISDGFSVIPEVKWMILFINSLKNYNHSYSSVIDYTQVLSNLLPTANFKNSNQYKIVTANSIQSLIIPLVKGSKDENWDHKRISYDHNWIKEHKNALQTAYGKSPFFEYYDYKLFSAFDSRPEYLCELNQNIMNMILPYLGLNHFHFKDSSSYSKDLSSCEKIEIRSNFEISDSLNHVEDPTINIFPTLPTTMKVPEYTQVFDVKFGFQPDVSILDLLFNLGPLSNEYFKNL